MKKIRFEQGFRFAEKRNFSISKKKPSHKNQAFKSLRAQKNFFLFPQKFFLLFHFDFTQSKPQESYFYLKITISLWSPNNSQLHF